MLQFHEPVVRFGTSGTLILLYSIVDHAARRFGADPLRARPKSPRWLAALVFLSITAFYLCIKPTGGALLGGVGNVAGILLCFVAMAARWAARRPLQRVRMPDVAARMAFYAALPLAVGTPLGWLSLSLPATLASAVVCAREDRLLLQHIGADYRERMGSSARWIPGVF